MTAATPGFIHLRLHTEFSLTDSVVRVGPLINRLKELEMPACGVTDIANFYGLIKFYTKCEGSGVKPIAGTDLTLVDEEGNESLITLLAMNDVGYKKITELISKGWQHGQYHGAARVQRDWVRDHAEGVIALSGGRFGDVGKAVIAGRKQQAEQLLAAWQADFPNRFYLELTRTGRENEEDYLHAAVALAEKMQCPVVATNDVRFLHADEFEVHEARVCIGEGRALDDPRRERRYSEQQYLRSAEEMADLFSDIPEALANSVEIAKRCSVNIQLGTYFLPDYPIPDDFEQGEIFSIYPLDYMREEARTAMAGKWEGKESTPEYAEALRVNVFFQKITYEGLEWRLERILQRDDPDYDSKRQAFIDRLRFELGIIMQMGFPGYFLIVMDFIQWAKDNGIPVGPGRGSGAGSLVAYAQKITDLDPLEYDLLFERFLNPERVSMPDFDVDFCMENRDKVISYVADKYGRDAVSQIITFGTMAAKAVVRDVARVQGKSYGLADKLSKMIPPTPGMTLKQALEEEPLLKEFIETDGEAGEIWEMAVKLEGLTRNVGKHAGGVVIAPTKLTDFAPLYCDETGGGLVTQYDKNDVESAGLVKFDFLGLRTLTIIDWAVKMIDRDRQKTGEPPLDISALPLDDEKTFKLLKRAETTAVFQLESRGMKDLIKRLQPDNLEDMIALVALFRPGPLQSGMVDDFINRKHGRAKVAYPDATYQHMSLKPILEPTYGVIVYQEQVMQIAQVLAGYTLGGADMLRRAMGKKKPEEMAKQRSTFENGAADQGVDPDLAMKIFDLVEKFAGYGFNKSHSAAYALVSYQTAWLKAHYPAHFMAATMSSDMDKTDKVVTFIEECREMGLKLLPPDVNAGEFMFNVNPEGAIVYGLGAIKGLGEGPVDNIIQARNSGGPFTSLFDFCARIDPRKVNKRALEALVRSGAFDTIGPQQSLDYDRAVLMSAIGEAVKAAEQSHANEAAGMMDLFGEVVPTAAAEDDDVYSEFRGVKSWTMRERLEGERDTLGLYLTGHPIDEYARELKYLVSNRIADLKPEKSNQRVAGLVVAMRVMKTKRGDTMAFVSLDDRSGRIEVALFSDTYNNYREKIVKDAMLVIEGQVSHDDYSGMLKMRADSVNTLGEARAGLARGVHMEWQREAIADKQVEALIQVLNQHRGGNCPVSVDLRNDIARGRVLFGSEWKVNASEQLLTELRDIFGEEAVRMVY
ncbi:DNA polymerase III subunit alpha [Simiduia agarivorans]|uniref:DNA polymerase III subunit alpha n=1 Tax=Simiduia agarivorans (strain DSM 21679 / JCM 13881 / BCRC 17597 / SA1) TaxID=1117647 RepID=K4KGM9_SIMAS|nr:DNA polymerase III subunit alpha [Simiduia agarivorans]AFU98244.1 DNA polymerase III subunit alpha [Simiduia agarivorans SA1 = DSM 21679]